MSYSTYEDYNSFKALAEYIDPESFGHILGAGSQSIVIKPYFEYYAETSIVEPVLILTLETEKFELLQNIFEGSGASVERVNKEDLGEEYAEALSYLEDEGWNIFYSSKLDHYNLDESEFIEALVGLQDNFNQTIYNSTGFPVDYIIGEFKSEYLFMRDKEEVSDLDQKILDAIEHSLNAVKKMNTGSDFFLDIHENQFCSFKGEIFCVDPVLFNIEYLSR